MEVIVYAMTSGKEPFNDWLCSLDHSVALLVRARLRRLQTGHFGNSKNLKGGLYELKLKTPALRIYYAQVGRQLILLISGGDKTRQSADISKAKMYLADYRRRYGK